LPTNNSGFSMATTCWQTTGLISVVHQLFASPNMPNEKAGLCLINGLTLKYGKHNWPCSGNVKGNSFAANPVFSFVDMSLFTPRFTNKCQWFRMSVKASCDWGVDEEAKSFCLLCCLATWLYCTSFFFCLNVTAYAMTCCDIVCISAGKFY